MFEQDRPKLGREQSAAPVASFIFNLDWETAARAALIWAAEYTMLSMIEDSSHLLKVMTIICALSGLVVLEARKTIFLHYGKTLWLIVVATISVTYLGFVVYAITDLYEHRLIRAKLRSIYIAAGPIIDRKIPAISIPGARPSEVPGVEYDQTAVSKFVLDAKEWESTTAQWLQDNIGFAARERFLDLSSIQSYCWGPSNDVNVLCDNKYDLQKNRTIVEKRNLSAIMESSAYDE
ncbi:MAG: hypothetical protein ABSE69_02400 [Roseiarcus sp.]|jgi:hypothetical protein